TLHDGPLLSRLEDPPVVVVAGGIEARRPAGSIITEIGKGGQHRPKILSATPAPSPPSPKRMEPIRYRPGEAIRWLEIGASDSRKSAKRQGRSIVRREGSRTIGRDLRDAAGAIFELGKSALADLAHRQAQASEVVLQEETFTISNPTKNQTLRYDQVTYMKLKGDRLSINLEQGGAMIKPDVY